MFQFISNGVQKYPTLICVLLGKVNQGKASSKIPVQEKLKEGLFAHLKLSLQNLCLVSLFKSLSV